MPAALVVLAVGAAAYTAADSQNGGTPGPEIKALTEEETQAAANKADAEQKRNRQLVAQQQALLKTSPQGAAIKQGMLGGAPTIVGG